MMMMMMMMMIVMLLITTERRCEHGALRCDSGRCIPPQLICNGHIDCGIYDPSDERNCPGED